MSLNLKRFILRGQDRLPVGAARDAAAEQARAIKELADALADLQASAAATQASIDFLDDGQTVIVRIGAACPTGWTEDTSFQGRFPLGVNGTYAADTFGGSDTHTHNAGGPTTGFNFFPAASGTNQTVASNTHTHVIGNAQTLPPYRTVVYCRKV